MQTLAYPALRSTSVVSKTVRVRGALVRAQHFVHEQLRVIAALGGS
jgi:hypothetical protein